MPNLYIIATPIGNLKDITLRALETLKEVNLILCEDTRATKKLLDYYNIKTPTLSYHQHSKLQKVEYIINLLKRGKNLALVSSSGTPGISDPGGKLVKKVIELLGDSVKIIPIPGPSAMAAAASIANFPMDRFLFLGFPPTKKKRKKFFEEIVRAKYPIIFYESPHRIIKTLCDLNSSYNLCCGADCSMVEIMVCRELTKKFETIYRGDILRVIRKIKKDKTKGEFVVVVRSRK